MPATTVETLIYKVEVDDGGAFDGWEKRLDSIKKKSASAFGGMVTSLGGVTAALNLAVGGVATLVKGVSDLGKDAVKDSIALEDAMNGVKRTADLTTEQVSSLTKNVRDYSVETLKGFGSSKQLAEALEIAGQQGVFVGKTFEQGSQDALAFAGTMVKAAVALDGLDLQKAAEKLGLFHGAFSSSIPDIERAASVLNFFGNTTKRGADFILTLSGNLAQAAKDAGLTEQQTLALAATLGNLNQAASKSGTGMSRILMQIQARSAEFAEAFGLDAAKFKQLVQEDMSLALVVLFSRINELKQTKAGMDVLNQGMLDLRITGQGVSTVFKGLGDLVPTFVAAMKDSEKEWRKNTSLMEEFTSSSDRTSKLWEALQEIWKSTVGVFSDALLPVFREVLKEIQTGAIELQQWASKSEFLKTDLPAAISRLVQGLRQFIKQAIKAAKEVDWSEVLKQTKAAAVGFFDFMTKALPKLLELLTKIVNAITFIGENWDAIKTSISAAIKLLSGNFGGLFTQLTEFSGVIDDIGQTFSDVFSAMGGWIDGIGGKLSGMIGTLGGLIDKLRGVEEQATGGSTFPDMAKWADIAAKSIEGIGKATDHISPKIAALSPQGSVEGLTPSYAGASGSRPRGGPTTSGRREGVTNIIFQGQNIVDESSKNRFARNVSQRQHGLGARVIRSEA